MDKLTCKATSQQNRGSKINYVCMYVGSHDASKLHKSTVLPLFTKDFTVPVQPHPTTSRHFDSFHGFSQPCLCLKVSSTYLPVPHSAHNWHSLSSAAFGGFWFDPVPCLSHWAFCPKLNLYFVFTFFSPHLAIKKTVRGHLVTHAHCSGCGRERINYLEKKWHSLLDRPKLSTVQWVYFKQ